MEPLFFFFDDAESLEEATLEVVEARLGGEALATSLDGRERTEAALRSGVVGREWESV